MTDAKKPSELGGDITRRDFIGASLVGTGAVLLGAPCPAAAQQIGRAWTGYGGVGDYRFSNGNTADVVRSAHRIRDGSYKGSLNSVIETGETYDLLIVGAGFTGMAALYEFKKARPNGKCLLIDNHAIFGGEAKQNEFDVGGYRVTGPQGSNNTPVLRPDVYRLLISNPDPNWNYWQELELPTRFEMAQRQGGDPSITFQRTSYSPFWEKAPSIGYFFENQSTGPKGLWVKNPAANDFTDTPLPDLMKKALVAWRHYRSPVNFRDVFHGTGNAAWLDSMSYAHLVTEVMRLPREILRYADAYLAANVSGASSDVTSAYAAGMEAMPGTVSFDAMPEFADTDSGSFPGGNTTVLRHFVKAVFPNAIAGPRAFAAIANNPVNFDELDHSQSNLRMRLRATAVRVSHEGEPSHSDYINLVYEKGGKLYRVRAKAAVLGIGSWVARHIVAELPGEYRTAFANIFHGPMLVVNVALHNWRFMDKLGISGAGWFDGFGYFANIRHPMVIGNRPVAFRPDKPAVMTFYVPILKTGLPIETQGPAGRAELFATSYASYESQIVTQLQRLFSRAGFDARRDIAGIVLNRWGHAYVTPQPGFFFGTDGQPAPRDIVRRRFGRIAFAHAELQGLQSWWGATTEGKRALTQVLEVI